jgi:cytochrome c oxidase assembly protein subunit 15
MALVSPTTSRDRGVAAWLVVCAAFVAAMVVVGGLTRLTRSGLSIVEWKPLLGAIPPLTDADWRSELGKYQGSPEAKFVNVGLSLEAFKQIYYVEWFHRLLGRVTGLVVLLPLIFFAVRKRLDRRRVSQLLTLFALGGLQGALGWFMVASGLVDAPRVSPFRLTAHLLLALLLFASLFWVALDAAVPRPLRVEGTGGQRIRPLAWALAVLLTLTITWGGLMAGNHAGLAAPTFPTINGAFLPDGMWDPALGLSNVCDNALLIHFTHRLLAYLTVAGALILGIAMARTRGAPRAWSWIALGLGAIALAQATLGALTVLSGVRIAWASLHQLNAVLLLAMVVYAVRELTPGRAPLPATVRALGPDAHASEGTPSSLY